MALQRIGSTTHFFYEYDDVLGNDGLGLATGLMASCENDLARIDQYLPHQMGDAGDIFARFPVIVRIQTENNLPGDPAGTVGPPSGGANNSGNPAKSFQSDIIRINPSLGGVVIYSLQSARFLFVAEMSEQNMQFYGWNPADSQGEGISRWIAYKLYPNPEVDVNGWMTQDPRPDWINNIFTGTATTRGDLDPVSYGCSLIFLNYVESQLELSVRDFLLAGGNNMADRYHNLTKLADDPFQMMNNLLLAHYPKAASLATNNPFPLYDLRHRGVFFDFPAATSTPAGLQLEGGIAHLSPYFTCPARDYSYTLQTSSQTRSVIASTVGFGNPDFLWKVEGIPVFLGSGSSSFSVDVAVPNPAAPGVPTQTEGRLNFKYSIIESGIQNGKTSTLTLTNESFEGDYEIAISVDVREDVEGGFPVTASQQVDLVGLKVQYEVQYYIDQVRCKTRVEKILHDIPRLEQLIDIVKTLPDPPAERTLNRALLAVGEIRRLVAREAERDPERAERIAAAAAVSLGVSREVFMGRGEALPRTSQLAEMESGGE